MSQVQVILTECPVQGQQKVPAQKNPHVSYKSNWRGKTNVDGVKKTSRQLCTQQYYAI